MMGTLFPTFARNAGEFPLFLTGLPTPSLPGCGPANARMNPLLHILEKAAPGRVSCLGDVPRLISRYFLPQADTESMITKGSSVVCEISDFPPQRLSPT